MKLTHLHLVPTLRISAPITLLFLYAFMTRTGKEIYLLLLTLAVPKHSEDSTWATAQRDLMQCGVWLWHSRIRLTKCPLYQNWEHQTLQCSGNRSRPLTHTIWWVCFGKTNDPILQHLQTLCADVRWDSRQFHHMSSSRPLCQGQFHKSLQYLFQKLHENLWSLLWGWTPTYLFSAS